MYFHFQFLVEDQSGAVLIDILMKKISGIYPNITYSIKSFKGIGGFTPQNTVKEIKTGKILNDLSTYLRGFNRSLKDMNAAIFVVLDNDTRNTVEFKKELKNVAQQNLITKDHVFCIAVEEIEAWLLGDESAIISAYPNAKVSVIHNYLQDSICDTWETLADAVYPGGRNKLLKNCTSYREIGKIKSEWAKNIGGYLNIKDNKSPSFNYMINEICQRAV